jgi:hypothetical protein
MVRDSARVRERENTHKYASKQSNASFETRQTESDRRLFSILLPFFVHSFEDKSHPILTIACISLIPISRSIIPLPYSWKNLAQEKKELNLTQKEGRNIRAIYTIT